MWVFLLFSFDFSFAPQLGILEIMDLLFLVKENQSELQKLRERGEIMSSLVPIQRIIIPVSAGFSLSPRHSAKNFISSIATIHALIRNCSVSKYDIQVGEDRTFGRKFEYLFKSTDKNFKKRLQRMSRKDRTEELQTIQKQKPKWDRPTAYADLFCSLFCDRLMLGEPPVRCAIVVPSVVEDVQERFDSAAAPSPDVAALGGVTASSFENGVYDCVTRVMQTYGKTVDAQDILFLDSPIVAKSSSSSPPSSFLGSARDYGDRLFTESSPTRMTGLAAALAAVSACSPSSDQSSSSPSAAAEWTTILAHAPLLDQEDDDEVDAKQNKVPGLDDEDDALSEFDRRMEHELRVSAMIAACWATHPVEAARLSALHNRICASASSSSASDRATKFDRLLLGGDGGDADLRGGGGGGKHLFQMSMLSVRDENVLSAHREPELMNAYVPGLPPTQLEKLADGALERVAEKHQYENVLRAEGKLALQRLQRHTERTI